MNQMKKRQIRINGKLLTPVSVGDCVYISRKGQSSIRTSQVVAVHELSDSVARFETLNSEYYVAFSPIPLTLYITRPMYQLCA